MRRGRRPKFRHHLAPSKFCMKNGTGQCEEDSDKTQRVMYGNGIENINKMHATIEKYEDKFKDTWRHTYISKITNKYRKIRPRYDVILEMVKNFIATVNLLYFWWLRVSTKKTVEVQECSLTLCQTNLWPLILLIFPFFVLIRKQTSVGIRSRFSSKKAARFLKCFDSCQDFLRWLVVPLPDIVRLFSARSCQQYSTLLRMKESVRRTYCRPKENLSLAPQMSKPRKIKWRKLSKLFFRTVSIIVYPARAGKNQTTPF